MALRCCVEFLSTGGWDVCMGNIRVLDKLRSGISCSTVGPECNVNESTIILNKVSLKRNTHKTNLGIYQLLRMLGPEAHRT